MMRNVSRMNLFELLAAKFPDDSAAAIAARLGISRQAYQQATARRRLSDSAALRAAALLEIDPGQALLTNATGQHPAPPVNHPAPHPSDDPAENRANNTNYAYLHGTKKSGESAPLGNLHVITSQNQAEALDLVKWVFTVANLRADSPRFDYYVSRWNVPEKIARAKAAGTFASTTANCPPIDPAWLRLVPSALAECQRYNDEINGHRKTPQSSDIQPRARNVQTARAA